MLKLIVGLPVNVLGVTMKVKFQEKIIQLY